MNDRETLFTELYHEDVFKIKGGTVIVLNKAWHDLPESEVELLAKILSAVKLNLAAVQIISMEKISTEALEIRGAQQVLLFGASINPPVTPYECSTFGNLKIIAADQLSALDDARKKNLWVALKEMFKK